jgi:hypothetical protein
MWTDTLEGNRDAMAAMLEAQEGKFAEIADAARRRTQVSLEAEVERSNVARKSALDAMCTSFVRAQLRVHACACARV